MRKIALADEVWVGLMSHELQPMQSLLEVGGRTSAYQDFVRAWKLWAHNRGLRPWGFDDWDPPGIDEYSVLVVIETNRNGTGVLHGIFDVVEEPDGLGFSVDVGFESPSLRQYGIDVNLRDNEASFAVFLALVRKRDGKCLRLLWQASISDVQPDYIYLQESSLRLRSQLHGTESCDLTIENWQGETDGDSCFLTGFEGLSLGFWKQDPNDDEEPKRSCREVLQSLHRAGSEAWHLDNQWL